MNTHDYASAHMVDNIYLAFKERSQPDRSSEGQYSNYYCNNVYYN